MSLFVGWDLLGLRMVRSLFKIDLLGYNELRYVDIGIVFYGHRGYGDWNWITLQDTI